MKLLEYEPLLNKLKKKFNLFLAIFIVLSIIALGGFIFSCLKINYLNQNIVKVITLSIALVLSLVIFMILFVFLLPIKNHINHIKKVISGNKTKATGEIVNIKNDVTIEKVAVTEIDFQDGDDYWVYYFDNLYFDSNFHVGDKLTYIVSNNFIYALEDKYEKD